MGGPGFNLGTGLFATARRVYSHSRRKAKKLIPVKERNELYRGTEKDNADFDITLPRAFYLLLHH